MALDPRIIVALQEITQEELKVLAKELEAEGDFDLADAARITKRVMARTNPLRRVEEKIGRKLTRNELSELALHTNNTPPKEKN